MKNLIVAGLTLLGLLSPSVFASPSQDAEKATLDRLYKDALAEGGDLVVYAGGDTPGSSDGWARAFEAKFPGLKVRSLTDLSKFHDARIDNQITRNRLVVDVAHLQTLHDFARWKKTGMLMKYVPPVGWSKVPVELKDIDGYYTGIGIFTLGNVVNTSIVPAAQAPRNALDFLLPKFKDQLVLTYPHDDDAILFIFQQIIQKHGWQYMDALMAQKPKFRRGTEGAGSDVDSGRYAASFTAWWPFAPPAGSATRYIPPVGEPLMSWPQTAAIFKAAPHPAAAKLYVSWLLSAEVQGSALIAQWPVRDDVTPASGFGPVSKYNTDPAAFARFMEDRPALERFRAELSLYIGEVEGTNPTEASGTDVSASVFSH